MSLDHINLWAIADGDGWTLVDTGMMTSRASEDWETILAGPLRGRLIKRVICTHMHPDHVGMAGWLTRRFDCRLLMTRLEYLTCLMLVDLARREMTESVLRFYRTAGWSSADLINYISQFDTFGTAMHTLPDSFKCISHGEEIVIGEHRWRAVIGRGHSPEHLCLYCPDLRLFISGDQVLPKITSNVSVFATEPDADPLTDWLESLAAIRRIVPDDVCVLPAHNEPFCGLHERIDQLIDGHERSLGRLVEVLAAPKRATDVFGVLFRRLVNEETLQMATGESLAHLNCFIQRGRVSMSRDFDGVSWYRTV